MTQERFAEDLGWSVKYLQRVEAGRQNLSVGSLVHIGTALGVDAAKLFVQPNSLATRPGRPPTAKSSPVRSASPAKRPLALAANPTRGADRKPPKDRKKLPQAEAGKRRR